MLMTISILLTILGMAFGSAHAMPQGSPSARAQAAAFNDAVRESIESYVVDRGLRARAEAVRSDRRRSDRTPAGPSAVAPTVGKAVSGTIEIPVIATSFSDTSEPPYPTADLQKQLFDGPQPTGTMTQHYLEMSKGRLTVTGDVSGWIKMPRTEDFYAGPAGCNGICANARLGELLTEALARLDGSIDFRQFDNDGPDGQPNSADDDGFVDFVAFVHPSLGGECGANKSIWSHQWRMSNWKDTPAYETNDASIKGGSVRIDDYVIMPALACDRSTMIQIGVFSHEFGHAFGLPDLYDSIEPADSSGVGTWGLMASGSWGGDNGHPERPSHMEAWSKQYLGWARIRHVLADAMQVEVPPSSVSNDAVLVDYTNAADPQDVRYLLIEYRKREGFDDKLHADGLLVTEINESRVRSGLVTNSVNGEPFDLGVNVIEADGTRGLDRGDNRGDAGDVFVAGGVANLDGSHAEKPRAALCNISVGPESVKLDIYVSRQSCPETVSASAVPPSTATQTGQVAGAELVVEGTLENAGTNFFDDLRLVVRGSDGSEIPVTSPVPQAAAVPRPSSLPSPRNASPDSADRRSLPDLLGKKVIVRGELERQFQRRTGLTDTLKVEELKVLRD